MNLAFKTLAVFFGVIIFQSNILVGGTDQDQQPTSQFQRTKENFDQSWQFHKGDIALKRVIQAGGQGGLTDTNVKIISNRDTVIDYTSENSFKVFYPADWREINVPHGY